MNLQSMGKTIVGIFFLSLSFTAFSQNVVNPKVDFGKLNVGKIDSQQINVHLGAFTELNVDIKVYGQGFSVSRNKKKLVRGADTSIWVIFSPKQNVSYKGALFLGFNEIWHMAANITANGRIANSYYNSTFDLWDDDLLDELQDITSSGQKSLGYNGARDQMYGDLDNVNGKVTCVYTGRTATFNSRSGANNNSFNCEHTWPQSKFCSNESSTMKADIHHLFPTDVSANSRRSSYPFGEVTNSTWQEGGSKLGGGLFEPRDEQKGATARAMLYMVMRYGDCDGFLGTQENTLRKWSKANEPNDFEKQRNDGIYDLQKNRNPFVDAPQLLDRIIAIKGGKTRQTSAAAELVDDILEIKKQIEDSAIYIAYIVNTGSADLDIEGVQHSELLDYSMPKTKLAPGEKVGIRMALSYPVGGLYNAYIQFKQSNVDDIEVLFEPTVSIESNSRIYIEPTVSGQTIDFGSYKGELKIFAVSGKKLFDAQVSGKVIIPNLTAYKGVAIISIQTEHKTLSKKVILR
ncbi:MAG: endonuclease I family protein [Bacteroidia bacterium]